MATYTVSLEYQPISSLSLLILRASGDSDLTVDPALLSFSTTNWNTVQTVIVVSGRGRRPYQRRDRIPPLRPGRRLRLAGPGLDNHRTGQRFRNTSCSQALLSPSPRVRTASYGVTLSNQPSGNVTITPTVTGDDRYYRPPRHSHFHHFQLAGFAIFHRLRG